MSKKVQSNSKVMHCRRITNLLPLIHCSYITYNDTKILTSNLFTNIFLQKIHQSFFSIATFIDSKDSWGLFAAVQVSTQKDGKVKTRKKNYGQYTFRYTRTN